MKIRAARTILSSITIKTLLSLTFACFYVSGYAQKLKAEDKIAPAFKLLIEKNKITNTPAKKKCFLSKKTSKQSILKKQGEEKTYDCIVYTKNAEAVRSKGIIVNSTLPSFITAKATLQQILLMASLKEVTYIDTPFTDVINH